MKITDTMNTNTNLSQGKDTLFGIPKQKSTLKLIFQRNFLIPWFERLVKNQMDEDIERFTQEIDEGMRRYMSDSDREHKRVHDMQYLCQLKIRMWSEAIISIFHQRFAMGMCCGAMIVGSFHIIANLIKWWLS